MSESMTDEFKTLLEIVDCHSGILRTGVSRNWSPGMTDLTTEKLMEACGYTADKDADHYTIWRKPKPDHKFFSMRRWYSPLTNLHDAATLVWEMGYAWAHNGRVELQPEAIARALCECLYELVSKENG